jgi:predicted lipoprotein with Yx(FWY)xxD motif
MKHLPTFAAMLIATASFAAPLMSAMAADVPAKLANGVLVDAKGMTLYTFDKDMAGSGKSACSGPCAALWPPAMAAAGDQPAGAYTIVVRDDGARQWAYKGKPVYTYQADQKPGDRAGDNFKEVWHIIKE